MAQVQLVRWRGGRMTQPFAESQARVAEMVPGFVLTQGGWNAGGVAASAGTHDRDAADYSVRDKTRAEVEAFIAAQRECGNAAWFRTTRVAKWGVRAHGFSSYHVHVVPNLWSLASAGARHQANEYRAGRDGLAGRGADVGPGHTSAYRRRTWPSYLALPSTNRPTTPTPAPDTRTPLERLLDTMDEKKLREIIRSESRAALYADLVDGGGTSGDPARDGSINNAIWHIAARIQKDNQVANARAGANQALWDKMIDGHAGVPGSSVRNNLLHIYNATTASVAILRDLAKRQGVQVDEQAIAASLAEILAPVMRATIADVARGGGTPEQIADAVVARMGAALVEG